MCGGVRSAWLCSMQLLRHYQVSSMTCAARGLVLVLCEPARSSPLLPLAISFFASCCRVGTRPVLFAVLPLALVLPAIGPLENARARLLVVVVLTLIAAPIAPREEPFAVHSVLCPLALVPAA